MVDDMSARSCATAIAKPLIACGAFDNRCWIVNAAVFAGMRWQLGEIVF